MSEETASTTETIHVYLLDEGTDVWRPTQGRRIGPMQFEVLPTRDYDASDEDWQFVPGTLVQCEERVLSGAPVKVAVHSIHNGRSEDSASPPQ